MYSQWNETEHYSVRNEINAENCGFLNFIIIVTQQLSSIYCTLMHRNFPTHYREDMQSTCLLTHVLRQCDKTLPLTCLRQHVRMHVMPTCRHTHTKKQTHVNVVNAERSFLVLFKIILHLKNILWLITKSVFV